MRITTPFTAVIGISVLLFSSGSMPVYPKTSGEIQSQQTTTRSQQTTTKSQKTTGKSQQTKKPQTATKSKPAPAKPSPSKPPVDPNAIKIGDQTWAKANLNVSTFRNGDTIPEAKTFKEWVAAGEAQKPVWCYYNNDPAMGQKYGRLYNWFALADPRGLAPKDWSLPADEDWMKLKAFLGGQEVSGTKLKSTTGWQEGNNGTNESGFNGLPGGYRVENGAFINLGNTAVWWSTTEYNTLSSIDHYLILRGSFNRSNSPKPRGSYVRCIKK